MARIEKTVFISYRRTDVYTALAVYENLKNQGYDVFFDYRSISSGDFEQIISSNIRARAHFLLILTPTALDRCDEPGDWLRREIEIAIDEKRNIIPLFFKGFRFGNPSVTEKLTGKLRNLSRYNGLNVHEDYFDEAMHRVRTQYLNIPLDTVLHPVSTEVQKVVREEQVAADKALEQIEDVKELVKHVEENPDQPKAEPKPQRKVSVRREAVHSPTAGSRFNVRLIGGIAGVSLILGFLIWGASKLLGDLPTATPAPTLTFQTSVTFASQPSTTIVSQATKTNMPSPTQTAVPLTQTGNPPTSNLGVGPTMTGKDGMTLLYVPAGEFTMGSNYGAAEEKPAHSVNLDAFWIDQTEVTVEMYTRCVSAGVCKDKSPYTQTDYLSNPKFNKYPMTLVSWEDATTYCGWVERRLPTEAEWEKAARGENGFVYPWGNEFDGARVNFCDKNCSVGTPTVSSDDGFAETAPVGSYLDGTSHYGALDMAGNVWELVADWYNETYYTKSPAFNPLGPDSGRYRVMRGGSWVTNSDFGLRSSYRAWLGPITTNFDVGFRCALSAAP
ncbi:MAG TPA: SUMF1/EgtB/PvdO family nonheme iron enzyme [Anaerolineales bacterium]